MAGPVVAHQTRVALGIESTWATGVTPDRSIRVVSCNLARFVSKEAAEHMLHSASSRNAARRVLTEEGFGGPVVAEALYEGMGVLYKAGFGSLATTGPSGGIYTHVYSIQLAAAPSLTLEQIQYDAGAPGYRGLTGVGCMVDSFTIRGRVGKVVMIEAELMGKAGTDTTTTVTDTTTAPFTTTHSPVKFHKAGTITWNAVTLRVTGFTATIKQGLERRVAFGALTTAQPVGTRQSVTVQLEVEWDGATFDQGLTDDTSAAFALPFTDGSNQFNLAAAAAVVTGMSRPVSGNGIVKATISLVCFSDLSANEGLTLTVKNTQSSGIAV